MTAQEIKAVDLFCGIGGLTHGLSKAGIPVVAGIDNDSDCRFGYERNNKSKFIEKDIAAVSAAELRKLFDGSSVRILAGCAPCQPFSKLNLKRIDHKALQPIEKFAQLIAEVRPEIVSMENVKGLVKNPIFKIFLENLKKNGYHVAYEIVDFSDYGVPQKRNRLVLLASRLGEIKLIPPTHAENKITVRDAIGGLQPIRDGETSEDDYLHRARLLSPMNKKRIRATPKNGGNSRSWDEELILKCHKKKSGKTYRGTVYGRMRWDEPAPTMTTQCIGIGNGRYGHPQQNRAISLREAALFQTFPKDYKFVDPDKKFIVGDVARFIGNAVPVRMGEVIAESIKKHLNEYRGR